MSISRQRLSTDVHRELLGQIIRGEFAPGQRLRDSELAENLGVSRTPVREALLRLEREGFISTQKHLGFSVKHLHESEIREIYPLVSLLECHALRSSPLPDPGKVESLRELAVSLRGEPCDPLKRIELDSAWHRALVEGAGSHHLLRILAELKRIVFRYEYSFMQVAEFVDESAAEHSAIVDALERGDRRRAVKLLGDHWNRCTEATLSDFLSRLKSSECADAVADPGRRA
ncbi:MAG: GntR family transcriptional regulator [Spirochaetes bacterium]|nr:GntR family transcriptional regulator [Spirochaetota bacterium]